MTQMENPTFHFGPQLDDRDLGDYKGYRLDRMCIRNFGGYHGDAQTLLFGINGTILTGANGAGKTTAIDAFTLLTNTSPSFNAAASGSSSRNVESYYKGVYGENQSAGTENCLRGLGDKEMPMGISATFTKANGEKFSIVRLTYISEARNTTNFYITADEAISLQGDFPIWLSYGALGGQAERYGWNLYNKFDDYLTKVAETFGFENGSQCRDAFRFLGKSIKQQSVTSVTKFARENILPEMDCSVMMDSAVSAIEKGEQQLKAIEKSREKITALQLIRSNFSEINSLEEKLDEDMHIKDRLPQFTADLRIAKSTGLKDFQTSKMETLNASLTTANNELAALLSDQKRVTEAIRDAGIDRVQGMRDEEADLARKINHRVESIRDLTRKFSQFDTHLDTGTQALWSKSFAKFKTESKKLEGSLEAKKSQKDDAYAQRAAQKSVFEKISAQLRSLEDSRTSLEPKLVIARDQIADKLGISKTQVPFFAELVQIRDGEEEWEGVANRVLNALGQTIMVPSENYREAKRIMDQGSWGTFVRLASAGPVNNPVNIKQGTLADKLMVLSDYPYQDAVRERLSKSAFHQCMEQDEFVRSSDPAVTKGGSIQRGAGQAEKNDRRNVNDSSTYILGWSVEDRIETTRQRVAIAAQKYEELNTHFKQWEETISMIERKLLRAEHEVLPEEAKYEEYDLSGLQAKIDLIRTELAVLESGQSFDLIERAEELVGQITILRKKEKSLESSISVCLDNVNTQEKDIDKQATFKSEQIESFGELTADQEMKLQEITAGIMDCSVDDVFSRVSASFDMDIVGFLSSIQRAVGDRESGVTQKLTSLRQTTHGKAEKFLREHSDETEYLSASGIMTQNNEGANRRNEWMVRLKQLEADNLTSAEDTQREELMASVQAAPAQLASAIEDFDLTVRRRISVINEILADYVYDPVDETYAKLAIKPASDTIITSFNEDLKHALSISLDYDQSTNIDAALRLVALLGGGENAQDKATKSILSDLRNRWDISLVEYYIDEDGNHIIKRDISTKADNLSGGQKERLTNLLTGAAMSSAFGAHDPFRRDKALLMVILDEAFANSSKESSCASSEIYKAMGIQVIVAAPSDKLIFDTGFAQRIIEVTSTGGQATSISQPMSDMDFDLDIDI